MHHSQVTGKSQGYAHDFCNMQVRENSQMQLSFIAHNFFGFDMFFLLKGIRISVWQTQDLNIGGSGYRTSILLASALKLNLLTP